MSVVLFDSDLDGSAALPYINLGCKDVCHFFMWHSTGDCFSFQIAPRVSLRWYFA